MISTDGRIDTDGNVLVSGDVEVTFQCINPPTHMPSVSPSVAPVESETPTKSPVSESPTKTPTVQPTLEPTGCSSKYTHYPGKRGNFQLLTGDELIPTDPVCVTNDDWTPPFCRDGKYPQGLAIGADRCKVACDARPNCNAIGIMYPNRGTSAECYLYGEPNNNNPLSSWNDFDWYNREAVCETAAEHYASWGSANSATTILASNNNIYGVRCVSDSDRSGDGWSKRMGCSVWTESDIWADGCVTKSWSEANAFCNQQSGRLPTLFEIEQNCLQGTGCQYDSQLIWSSTTQDRR